MTEGRDGAYDTVVIGAGQAGPFIAAKLAIRGKRVALIEARELGGTCINSGCTPTKTLRKSARVAALARGAAELGVRTGPVEVDFAAAMRRMREHVEQSRRGLEEWPSGLDGLDVVRAHARILQAAEFLPTILDRLRPLAAEARC